MSWISQDSPGVVLEGLGPGWVRVFQVPTATERLAAVAALEVTVPPEAPVEAEVDAEAVPLFWRVDLPEAQGGAGGWRGSLARHCDHCHIATWVYLQKRSDHDS